MNKELLTSRFFTVDDKRMDTFVFPLPSHWWSRFYEYAWAAEFCKETDVVLDAACGVPHPFKFYLAENCKVVYATDIDERIIDINEIKHDVESNFNIQTGVEVLNGRDNINFKHANITELPCKNNMFDKVFCISVLEHVSDEDKAKALKEFRRVLKNNGMIILTIDYPDATMEFIEGLANEAGLKLAAGKDVTIPQGAINWNNSLYCFRMVLVKDKDGE